MATEEDSSPIDCPACHKPMQPLAVDDINVDRCSSCGGVWLDVLERERLVAAGKVGTVDTDDALRAAPSNAVMNCPRDHARLIHMVDLKQPQIHFESCKLCGGMLFDAGELKDLSRFTLLERLKDFFRHGV